MSVMWESKRYKACLTHLCIYKDNVNFRSDLKVFYYKEATELSSRYTAR